jgi:hypothetical protein
MTTYDLDPRLLAARLLQEVEASVEDGLIPKRRGEYTQWTLAVKIWLAEEARKLGLRMLSNHDGDSEFMLDAVWWKNAPGERAILACECEWGNLRDVESNHLRVAEDFDKLLSFKAPLKLMIFDSYNDERLQGRVISELDRYLQGFGDHRAGEIYLAVDLSRQRKAWRCDIEADGEHPDLHFLAIAV